MPKLLRSQSFRVWATLFGLGVILLLARGELLGERPSEYVEDVRDDGPNAVGMDLITQNYYEELLKEDRQPEWRDAHLIHSLIKKLTGEDLRGEGDMQTWTSLAVVGGTVSHETGFLEHSLKPNVEVIHKDVPLKTNRWGHRDTDNYDKEPAPGVFRIALVGSSNTLATGVEMELGLEQLLERKLNETLPGRGGHERYEVINFSVPRYHLLERVFVARHVAPEFNPHMVLVAVTMRDMRRAVYESLARRVSEGRDLGFGFTREIVRRSHATSNDSKLKVEQRLQRFKSELIVGCFQELARVQRALDTPVVVMALRLEVDEVHPNLEQEASIAQDAGLVALRIFDAYEGQTGDEMYLAEDDYHPTAKGHALLADEVYADLLADPTVRRLLIPGEAESGMP